LRAGGYGAGAANSHSGATAVGSYALYNLTTGNYNLGLGYKAGENLTSGSGNIIIGYDIDAPSATANNQLNIGNLIFGTGLDGRNGTLSAGGVGIGIADPGVYKLYVNGAGYLADSAWTYSSDRSLKENIAYFEGAGYMDTIMSLKPARFDYIAGSKNQLGFIAQDIQQAIPEAVSITDAQTGLLGLKTDFILPYIVKGMQEQQNEIANIKLSLNNLGLIANATTTTEYAQNAQDLEKSHLFDYKGERPISWIQSVLANLGMALQEGVASLRKVVAEKIYSDETNSKKINTEELCVSGADGESVCITKDRLKEIIINSGSSVTINKTIVPPADSTSGASSATTTESSLDADGTLQHQLTQPESNETSSQEEESPNHDQPLPQPDDAAQEP